jgi:antitoxin component YwqK of YwqJK toxin-antitoxin module
MSKIRVELLLPDGTTDSSIVFKSNFGGRGSLYVISGKGDLYEEIFPGLNESEYRRNYLINFNGVVKFYEENGNIQYTTTFSNGRLSSISYEDVT